SRPCRPQVAALTLPYSPREPLSVCTVAVGHGRCGFCGRSSFPRYESAKAGSRVYELKTCPCCVTVRRALSDLELPYESRSVPSSRSRRSEVDEATGQSGVSVLVDRTNDIERMAESDDIVEYLSDEYGDDQSPPPSGLIDRSLSVFF
ncbi:MAG: glutaredoxin 3, partial [Natronomonas sp.]